MFKKGVAALLDILDPEAVLVHGHMSDYLLILRHHKTRISAVLRHSYACSGPVCSIQRIAFLCGFQRFYLVTFVTFFKKVTKAVKIAKIFQLISVILDWNSGMALIPFIISSKSLRFL